MRIILPTRIPVGKATVCISVFVLLELLEGTDPLYAALVFLYFFLSVLAFNVAGGLSRPSGAYVLFYSLLVGGVGTVYKAVLGQAANTNLESPLLTMGACVATLGELLLAALLTRRFATTKDGVAGILRVPKIDMFGSALGCLIMSFAINAAFAIFPGGSGSILHAISMVNVFLPVSILLGTIAAVERSHGARSTSALTIFAMSYSMFNYGLLAFSKQGMLTPFVCWFLGVAWARFRLRLVHVLAIIGFAILTQTFLTPLAAIGRNEKANDSQEARFATVEKYVLHPGELRREAKEKEVAYLGAGLWYYGSPSGLWDRLVMLPTDSVLINFTQQGHYFGYTPVFIYMENWVPHILNPHKLEGDVHVGGNAYAHELGGLADDDYSTGISYSSTAEAFHFDGWRSLLLVQLPVFLMLFLIFDGLSGDLRAQPWGLIPMLAFAHVAPEGGVGGPMYMMMNGTFGIIFAVLLSGYVTPVLGGLLKGRERVPIWKANEALSGPGPSGSTGVASA